MSRSRWTIAEIERLNQAKRLILGGSVVANKAVSTQGKTKTSKKKGLTAAGRRKLSRMMKARWAERRKQKKT
jgi:hypothetical protein